LVAFHIFQNLLREVDVTLKKSSSNPSSCSFSAFRWIDDNK